MEISIFGLSPTIWELILGVISTILAIMTFNLNSEKATRERTLAKLKTYGRNTSLIQYKYVDVVFFGPRKSGKTSIAELWTSPWTEIGNIRPTETWQTFEANIYEFDSKKRLDDLFEVQRTHIPTLRIRVRDYPGEDHYRLQAVKDLKDLDKKAVVVFIFLVGFHNQTIQYSRENAEYFSRAFVEEVNEHVQRISGSVTKAIVVFNKIDKLPRNWDDETILQKLKQANADAIYNIEKLFSGMLEYQLTSALTNEGIVRLLGSTGRVAIETEKDRVKFNQRLQKIEKDLSRIRV